jgi:hypothetical protein
MVVQVGAEFVRLWRTVCEYTAAMMTPSSGWSRTGVRRCRARAIPAKLRRTSWLRCRPWQASSGRPMICGASLPSSVRNTMDQLSAGSVVRHQTTRDKDDGVLV